jgi:hypothetical protein
VTVITGVSSYSRGGAGCGELLVVVGVLTNGPGGLDGGGSMGDETGCGADSSITLFFHSQGIIVKRNAIIVSRIMLHVSRYLMPDT